MVYKMRNRDDKQKEHLRQLIIKWNNYFVFCCMTQKQEQKHLLCSVPPGYCIWSYGRVVSFSSPNQRVYCRCRAGLIP